MSSIVPHSTNIVEFPVFAIVIICTILITEQTVVNMPNKKITSNAVFLLALICNCNNIGIGKKKMMQSKMMVIAART